MGNNAGNSLEDRDKKERKQKDGILQNLRCSVLGKCSKVLSFERKSCHLRYEPSSRALPQSKEDDDAVFFTLWLYIVDS